MTFCRSLIRSSVSTLLLKYKRDSQLMEYNMLFCGKVSCQVCIQKVVKLPLCHNLRKDAF